MQYLILIFRNHREFSADVKRITRFQIHKYVIMLFQPGGLLLSDDLSNGGLNELNVINPNAAGG